MSESHCSAAVAAAPRFDLWRWRVLRDGRAILFFRTVPRLVPRDTDFAQAYIPTACQHDDRTQHTIYIREEATQKKCENEIYKRFCDEAPAAPSGWFGAERMREATVVASRRRKQGENIVINQQVLWYAYCGLSSFSAAATGALRPWCVH
jgi:hypothetical protein